MRVIFRPPVATAVATEKLLDFSVRSTSERDARRPRMMASTSAHRTSIESPKRGMKVMPASLKDNEWATVRSLPVGQGTSTASAAHPPFRRETTSAAALSGSSRAKRAGGSGARRMRASASVSPDASASAFAASSGCRGARTMATSFIPRPYQNRRVGESRFQITSQAPGRAAPRAAWMTRSRPSAHELLDDLREAHLALDQGRGATLELDPTLVESVKHLDAGNRITHSLGAKDRAPLLARNGLCANRTMQRLRELRCDPDLAHPLRALELDDPLASPPLPQQFGCDPADISRGDHRHGPVEGLQEAGDDALLPSLGNVPTQVFHEPGGPKERDGQRQRGKRFFHQRTLGQ